MRSIAQPIGRSATRITAEGRADADPIAPNADAERRERRTGGSRSCCIAAAAEQRRTDGSDVVSGSCSPAGAQLHRHGAARAAGLVLRPAARRCWTDAIAACGHRARDPAASGPARISGCSTGGSASARRRWPRARQSIPADGRLGRGSRGAAGEADDGAAACCSKARGTRGYLYEQPWYVIIGPPGAGKTTALLNAGLQFPARRPRWARARSPASAARGSATGGSPSEAVLIDTAGRYTTQDSNAAVDRAGWEAFLDLLKRTRPRQPLNGVLVAIALQRHRRRRRASRAHGACARDPQADQGTRRRGSACGCRSMCCSPRPT